MTITMAAEASQLELNFAEPIIACDLLHGLMLLEAACATLATRCIPQIEADRRRCREDVENSVALVTALNPIIGYERCVAIAAEATESGERVYDLVLRKGWLSRQALDDLLEPENMIAPGLGRRLRDATNPPVTLPTARAGPSTVEVRH
jgi:aspartate ammonia-lyase